MFDPDSESTLNVSTPNLTDDSGAQLAQLADDEPSLDGDQPVPAPNAAEPLDPPPSLPKLAELARRLPQAAVACYRPQGASHRVCAFIAPDELEAPTADEPAADDSES